MQTGLGTKLGTSLMAKVLAGLFAAGASLALLTVALPHSSRASVPALLVIVGIAYLVAGLLFWRAGRLPVVLLPVALAWGSTLITAVAYFSGESPSPLIFFYLWIFLYSAYFFSTREMIAQVSYVGVVYGALLVARTPADGEPAWWLVGMGTLAVAAILVCLMRRRTEQLIVRLYDASRTDALTSLSNRRGYREVLDLELTRARRAGARMTVVVGNLDHFKEVNDRSGSRVGDAALKRVAGILERSKRDIDGLARVGGEEFALVLPDTNEHGAFIVAERLRCEVRDEFAADSVPVTISFGWRHTLAAARRPLRCCERPKRRCTRRSGVGATRRCSTVRRCGPRRIWTERPATSPPNACSGSCSISPRPSTCASAAPRGTRRLLAATRR